LAAVQALYDLKRAGLSKPMSILCRGFSDIDRYTQAGAGARSVRVRVHSRVYRFASTRFGAHYGTMTLRVVSITTLEPWNPAPHNLQP